MKGFSDHALFILPDWDIYEAMSESTKMILDQSMKTVMDYVKRCGMEIHCMNNDITATQLAYYCDTATAYAPSTSDVIWRAGFCPEDLIFARNNVDCMGRAMKPDYTDEENGDFAEARSEFPALRGMSIEDRFEVILLRCKYLSRRAIDRSKFVVTFEDRNKEVFKVKEGESADGRMIWRISSRSGYRLEAYLSGEKTNLKQFLPYENLYSPVYKWNVNKLIAVS